MFKLLLRNLQQLGTTQILKAQRMEASLKFEEKKNSENSGANFVKQITTVK
jgi:hypothetical protein